MFCLQHLTGPIITTKIKIGISKTQNHHKQQNIIDNNVYISSASQFLKGVMGSWLGVMVNQIRPLHYDDQATETIRFAVLVSTENQIWAKSTPHSKIWCGKEIVIEISGDWDDGVGVCGVPVHHVNRYQMNMQLLCWTGRKLRSKLFEEVQWWFL